MTLITGANGKPASAVVREFARNGRPVRALVREPAKAEGRPTAFARFARRYADVFRGDADYTVTPGPAMDGSPR